MVKPVVMNYAWERSCSSVPHPHFLYSRLKTRYFTGTAKETATDPTFPSQRFQTSLLLMDGI